MKPFPDESNRFKWFIDHFVINEQTGKPTDEQITTYYKSDNDWEKSLQKFQSFDALISWGRYNNKD